MDNVLIKMPIILGLTMAVTKLFKDTGFSPRYLPYVNAVTGVVIGLLYALSFEPEAIVTWAWAGFIAGLSAGGFYDLGKSTLGGKKYE